MIVKTTKSWGALHLFGFPFWVVIDGNRLCVGDFEIISGKTWNWRIFCVLVFISEYLVIYISRGMILACGLFIILSAVKPIPEVR